MNAKYLASFPDLFALALVLTLTALLTMGVKESTRFNNIFTVCNVTVVTYVIICGIFRIDFHNWSIKPEEIEPAYRESAGSGGFLPFGLTGVVNGAATCFFGFQGFDMIATASEEAHNPRRTIPLAICFCLLIVFIAYSGMAAVLTLIWPYYLQDPETPIPYAFQQLGWPVASWIVSIGTLFGLSTSLVGALFPLPRIIYSMAEDGLLFKAFARINHRTLTPTVATIASGLTAALLACLFNLQDLVDLMALSTLFVFAIVGACIIILRYRVEEDISIIAGESGEVDGLLAGVAQLSTSSFSQMSVHQLFFQRDRSPTHTSGTIVTWITVLFMAIVFVFSICLSYFSDYLLRQETWAISLLSGLGALMLLCIVIIHRLPQSPLELAFRVPLVPLLPALSIMINVYLMVNMRMVTWIQFAIYMALGLSVYIAYGWRYSKEEYRMQGKYGDSDDSK
jgi:amino acid transporter